VKLMVTDDELRRKAEKIAEEKMGVYIHVTIYLIVNILLYVIWWINGGIGTFPWPVIVTIGWGIGVVAHIFVTFGKGIDKSKMVEKEYQKLKEKNE
jgi:hypothetical protein